MNTIVKTYNNITKSLGRFFDIRRLLRNWLFSDIELHDMIYDEVYSQTSDNMSKVDDWVYEVESLEDKVNDFVKLANKDFSSLAKKYGLVCKNLVENPEQRTNYWENKGKKIIK